MAWTTISNALVAVGAKPFATTMQALRDNPVAVAGAESGAPVVAAGWHPFNMVSIGDGATGLLYSHAVTGNVASVETAVLSGPYDYRVEWRNLSRTISGLSNLSIDLRLTATAAYTISIPFGLISDGAVTYVNSGFIELTRPSFNGAFHTYSFGYLERSGATAHANTLGLTASGISGFTRAADTAIDRIRVTATNTTSIRQGTVYLFRRHTGGV